MSGDQANSSLLGKSGAVNDPQCSWRPIETAPKDGTAIVGWCVHAADPYFENESAGRLTTYGAHAEGLSRVQDGPHVVVWGGEYDDTDDGYIPDWWFLAGSDFETVANPTHWMPLPAWPDDDRESVSPGSERA